VERVPTATLIPATTIAFGAGADSNSPAVWELIEGRNQLFLFTSFDGWSTRHSGATVSTLVNMGPIDVAPRPPHGVWMEAIVPDVDGTWYGFYHNELLADVCDDQTRALPRIGAARSRDFGMTWDDLGIVFEAPRESHNCATTNQYFVGGVGDFSVMLDRDHRYLYMFFSQYGRPAAIQGVTVARMPWWARDHPSGRMSVWSGATTWLPPRRISWGRQGREYSYPSGVPIYRATDEWHEGMRVDAFWGPSVHWNTHLEQYVMLLNHAIDGGFRQEGIYVAFSKSLSDPTAWSVPRRVLPGGTWYPQVLGIEPGVGTDKVAGERARLYVGGRSQYFIQFNK
jgi:hypothetical protein